MWTSWDIVNTWEDHNSRDYINGVSYPSYKYWVDNQNIYFGYVLRNKDGNAVSLA